ncbi:hypothetical protein P22_2161 [Propionispora sp. 2/2-37]|uniref:DNA-processing protein DprA n=1 Tax=Propionispora sp. 2/2-37 TaxID=1677858 RepID=UPI0006BB7C8B|nr:DNA-processing protein DprA [Propionispora sp. 2/2-37]CUH96073.1 hypothetical protein P22_2161 [Propionispora sp. 2/2-37]
MNKLYLAALQMIPGIGTVKLKKLVSFFGSAQQAWQAGRRDLLLCKCLDEQTCNIFLEQREKINIETLATRWAKLSIRLCAIGEADYPELLTHIANPPMVLYYRGVLPDTDQIIAVVGARHASAYGKNAAQQLSAGISAEGFWVASGAARGIDTAAHRGALAVETGKTIAVLGCGVDVVYPPENAKLLAEIAEHGCVLSEYPPATKPIAGFFPARNRIISGISRGVIVVEAAERSGALITADFALEEGRDVFSVPGSIFSASSKGTHRLIKQGAKLVECAADILEEYGGTIKKKETGLTLTTDEQAVYNCIDYENPFSVEEIVIKSGLRPSVVTYILLQLELRGLAAEQKGQRYVRVAKEGIR